MNDVITFEVIKKIYEEEKKSENKLAPLPSDFFQKAIDYINKKKQIAKSKSDEKVFVEIKNLERILEEIFNMRERKILNLALVYLRSKTEVKNLTSEEEKIFNSIVKILEERRDVFKKALKGKISFIVFKKDYHQFVGFDGKKYGPFKVGDKVKIDEIPKEFINILKEANVVEVIESE
ncbi:MAG: hypothetical protein RMJ17_01220 [Candidatus Aenigmarchaeota archaeon]|nr:hypothetical protein [Candidatus Aenigmarchaeota archaeon]MDW8149204.1 hypothetical protein [Candidatus Aenigmarchaeota archaeon]